MISTTDLYNPIDEGMLALGQPTEWYLQNRPGEAPTEPKPGHQIRVQPWCSSGGNEAYEERRNERAALLAEKLGIILGIGESSWEGPEEEAEDQPYVMRHALNLHQAHSAGRADIFLGDLLPMVSAEEVQIRLAVRLRLSASEAPQLTSLKQP